MEEKEKEIKVEEKSFKERFAEKKEKAKEWINKNGSVIVPVVLTAGAGIIGYITHAVVDDMINGGKRVNWYSGWNANPELNRPNTAVYVETPTIREIKRGSTKGCKTLLSTDDEEYYDVFPEAKED